MSVNRYYQSYQPRPNIASSEGLSVDGILPRPVRKPLQHPNIAVSHRIEPAVTIEVTKKSPVGVVSKKSVISVEPNEMCPKLSIPRQRINLPNRRVTFLWAAKSIIGSAVIYALFSSPTLTVTDKYSLSFAAVALLVGFDSRIVYVLAFVALVDVPLLNALGYNHLSDNVAVAAFYLLCAGTLRGIIESIKDRSTSSATYTLYARGSC